MTPPDYTAKAREHIDAKAIWTTTTLHQRMRQEDISRLADLLREMYEAGITAALEVFETAEPCIRECSKVDIRGEIADLIPAPPSQEPGHDKG